MICFLSPSSEEEEEDVGDGADQSNKTYGLPYWIRENASKCNDERTLVTSEEESLRHEKRILRDKLFEEWILRCCALDAHKISLLLPRMEFVLFPRWLAGIHCKQALEDAPTIARTAYVRLDDVHRVRSHDAGVPIYCMGCVDRITNDRTSTLHMDTRPWKWERIVLLGFISEANAHLSIHPVKVEAFGGVALHDDFITDSSVVFPRSILSLDLWKCAQETWSPRKGKEEEEEEEAHQEPILEPLTTTPNAYVYVYHWDPPTAEDKDFLTHVFSLEEQVMKRLRVLCAHSQSLLPIQEASDYMRDRFCVHFLVTAMCTTLELSQWYVRAEHDLLHKNLAMLSSLDDRLLTLQRNDLSTTSVPHTKHPDEFTREVIRIQDERLERALHHARTASPVPALALQEIQRACVDYVRNAWEEREKKE